MIRSILQNYLHKNDQPLHILTFMGDAFYDNLIIKMSHQFHIWTKGVANSEWPNQPDNVEFINDEISNLFNYNLLLYYDRRTVGPAEKIANFWHIPTVNYQYINNQPVGQGNITVYASEAARGNSMGGIIQPYPEITEISARRGNKFFLAEHPKKESDLQILRTLGDIPIKFLSCLKEERAEQYEGCIGLINLESDFIPIPILEADYLELPYISVPNKELPEDRCTDHLDQHIHRLTSRPQSLTYNTQEKFEEQFNEALYSAIKTAYVRKI